MSFTAYTILSIPAPHAHDEIMVDQNATSVEFENASHTAVKIIHAAGYWRYSSPFPITVTRWAALIPLYLTPP